MVAGMHRSRTMRRVTRKLPGSRITKHYGLRKPSAVRCHETGQVLPGVARARPNQLKKLSKTERRPQRPFGGVLSGKAARARNIAHARSQNQ